jgi:uncharacterized protein (TIGR00159 family)
MALLDLIPPRIGWRDVLDIGLVAFMFYRLMLLVRGTRAAPVLVGLLLVLAMYFVSAELGLYTLNWLLGNFLSSFFLVVIILFQQDIRKALSAFGSGSFWKRSPESRDWLNALAEAMDELASRRIGALVVIERDVPLGDLAERGVALGARVSKDLLTTIFFPNTALHDGAVIVRNGRIIAAGCILPLSAGAQKQEYGTRHRAALGVTEESDAVAVVVSEERGIISVAMGGKLTTALDEVRLKRVLRNALEK